MALGWACACGPASGGRVELYRAAEGSDGVLETSLLQIDAGEIDRTVRAAQRLDLHKGLLGLAQRTVLGMTARYGSEGGTIHESKLKFRPPSVVRAQKTRSAPHASGLRAESKTVQSDGPLTR